MSKNKSRLKLTELVLNLSKSVGTICLQFFYHVGSFGLLIWRTLIAFSDFRTYKGHIADQMMKIGIRSLPLVSYIALFTGMVIALQSVKQFTSTVPLYISGTVVEKAILQELAGVITALVLAGRVGASICSRNWYYEGDRANRLLLNQWHLILFPILLFPDLSPVSPWYQS